MDDKCQTAIEYLLILGAAVAIAAIVIALLANLTSGTQNSANDILSRFLRGLLGG